MRALVMSGGGAKGAFEVGVLKKWIQEEGREYEILCGVSVGALNAAFLSQSPLGKLGEGYNKLVETWLKVNNDNIRKSWFLWKLAALWKSSVYDSTPLMKWVERDLDPKAVRESGRKLRVGAVSWETGEYYAATETDEDLQKWVAASASFPAFLSPVEIKGQLWTDGGVRNVTPLGEAIRLGADTIDIIMCSNPDAPDPWSPKGEHALPGFALRAISLLGDEVARNDLQVCGLKNDLAELGGKFRKVQVNLIQPTVPLGESLEFDPAEIVRMMKIGYEHAVAASV
jgi:NTE family protein